jgi:ParB family transcriptional regulator, chromosome partitioning protein
VQAALLDNPRKAKEVAVLLLLTGFRISIGARLDLHACHTMSTQEQVQRSYRAIGKVASELADRLGLETGKNDQSGSENGIARLTASGGSLPLYETLSLLTDIELDQLHILLPVLCFGEERLHELDTAESLFNRVATDIGIQIRSWWTPDAAFLSRLVREQVLAVAAECGAAMYIAGLDGRTKKQLVEDLTTYFAERSEPDKADVDENAAAREWIPGLFRFPAAKSVMAAPPAT